MDLPYPAVTPLCLPHFSFISFLSCFPSRLFLGRVSSIMHDVVLLGSLSFRMMCMYACVAYTLSTILALCLLPGLLCIYSTVNTSPVWGCYAKCKLWDALAIRRPAVQTWQFRKPGNEYTYCTFYTLCKQSNTPTSSWVEAWLSLTLHFFNKRYADLTPGLPIFTSCASNLPLAIYKRSRPHLFSSRLHVSSSHLCSSTLLSLFISPYVLPFPFPY